MEGLEKTNTGWIRRGRVGWLTGWPLHLAYASKTLGSIGTREVGRWGEWLALRHLRQLHWDILARNWTTRRGEVDIVAYDADFLVFVEVKTRLQSDRLPPPEEAVGVQKAAKLEYLAMEFLRRYELVDQPVRFDLIAIETIDLRQFELRHSTL